MRGENSSKAPIGSNETGTPPRAWGKRVPLAVEGKLFRYTPTCVGKTLFIVVRFKRKKVHPHVRGENLQPRFMTWATSGTPPRAWGKLSRYYPECQRIRYTPTCVGKTRDHGSRPGSWRGTPPRAWGKRCDALSAVPVKRYTPTCVGKTAGSELGLPAFAVHPHVRGENSGGQNTTFAPTGTPPRAWGKLIFGGFANRPARYTPTCVGKTSTGKNQFPAE